MKKFLSLFFFLVFIPIFSIFAQNTNVLSEEESLWLANRNNTIIVYPERNNPPFSYYDLTGKLQGFSIDYIELIASKIGINVSYLSPLPKKELIDEFLLNKGDVALLFSPTSQKELYLNFNKPYFETPFVLIARKDLNKRQFNTFHKLDGLTLGSVSSSGIETYVKENYPNILVKDFIDDEILLQKIFLGEVDLGVINLATFYHYSSLQAVTSLEVIGNTEFIYKPALAIQKNKDILNDILMKGTEQISPVEKKILLDNWINNSKYNIYTLPFLELSGFEVFLLGLLFVFFIIIIFLLLNFKNKNFNKKIDLFILKKDILNLTQANQKLVKDLEKVTKEEKELEEKFENLK